MNPGLVGGHTHASTSCPNPTDGQRPAVARPVLLGIDISTYVVTAVKRKPTHTGADAITHTT